MTRGELSRRSKPLDRLIEAGASLGGTTTGAAIGVAVAGPPGALAGAAGGWAVEEVLKAAGELARRHLAPREEMRIGAVLLQARDEIAARIVSGERPREDLHEFITPGRTPATELAEAVLRAAGDTYEERKLRYLAHLLAAITFEPDLSHAHANQLVRVAEALTYRQLVALAVYAELGGPYDRTDFEGAASEWSEESGEIVSLRADFLDLFRRGLVLVGKREQSVRREKPYRPSPSRSRNEWRPGQYEQVKETLPWPALPREMDPGDMSLSQEGARLARLMGLQEVPGNERQQLVLDHVRRPHE